MGRPSHLHPYVQHMTNGVSNVYPVLNDRSVFFLKILIVLVYRETVCYAWLLRCVVLQVAIAAVGPVVDEEPADAVHLSLPLRCLPNRLLSVCPVPIHFSDHSLEDRPLREEVVSPMPRAHRWVLMGAERCLVTRGLNSLFAVIRNSEDRSLRNPIDVTTDVVDLVLARSALVGLPQASIVRSCPPTRSVHPHRRHSALCIRQVGGMGDVHHADLAHRRFDLDHDVGPTGNPTGGL